jgi:RNA polymerase primary sigma factor
MINYTNLNENINIYFKEIRNFSSLNREDEIVLFSRVAKGDKTAEVEIFNKMAKLAVNIAKTYTCKADLLEDLIQEANLGILTAIKKYDLATGFRFSSYARWWMKAFIGKYLDEMGIVHHCNARLIDLANKIREKFYKENQREITEYELMEMLEDMGEVVNDTTAILNITSVRIDLPLGGDEEDITRGETGEFAEVTASHNNFIVEEEKETLSSDIAKRLSKLDTREQQLILMKFGFSTGYEMDYKSITEKWNEDVEKKALVEGWDEKKIKREQLTQERVRQIVVAALKKMK